MGTSASTAGSCSSRRQSRRMLIRSDRARSPRSADRDGSREHLLRRAGLDDVPWSPLAVDQEQRTRIGDPLSLLHVVRHDDDGQLLAELPDRVLDDTRGDGVEGRTRLVHQEDLGSDGQSSGNAQTLLLATRESRTGLVEAISGLPPQPGPLEALLDQGIGIAHLGAREPETRQHVLRDRHRRERIRSLEDHADRQPRLGHPHRRPVDVDTVEPDRSGKGRRGHELVHPIEDPKERRLAAARRADQRRDPPGLHGQRDPLEHLVGTEPRADVDRLQARIRRTGGRRRRVP